MANSSGLGSVGRFLYTQNPFYLLSCFLVIYGLQLLTLSQSTSLSRGVLLSSGLAAYSLLMTVTSVGVIRLGKVWQDGRSILLVVIISLTALSTAFDEMCISEWSLGWKLTLGGWLLSVWASEVVLRLCGIRFPTWYRLAYYGLMTLFYVTPVGLGYAVSERYEAVANWGSVMFSCGAGLTLLLLIPAMRRGKSYLRHNGTPWQWPLFPVSGFVVLLVLAGIRSHAIWISFGFFGDSLGFEPFLLLPMVFAVLILIAEVDLNRRSKHFAHGCLCVAPVMLLCGLGRGGVTALPIADSLQTIAGSAMTVCLATLVIYYAYLWMRGLSMAELATTASLLVMGTTVTLPESLREFAIDRSLFVAIAAMITLASAIRHRHSDVRWLAFASITAGAIALCGARFIEPTQAYALAAGWMLLSFLLIGLLFHTELAQILRYVAASVLVVGAGVTVAWYLDRGHDTKAFAVLLGTSLLTLFYWLATRRWTWVYVFAVQAGCLIGISAVGSYREGFIADGLMPLQLGMACFVVGVLITLGKTGLRERLLHDSSSLGMGRCFEMGL